MTGFRHYLTARGAWPALAVVVGVLSAAVGVRVAGQETRVTVYWIPAVSLVPLLVMVVLARTLAGADPALESSTPRLRPRWRVSHAATTVVLSAALLTPAGLLALNGTGASALTRNLLGVWGLALMTSTLLRAELVAAPTVAYILGVMIGAPHEGGRFTAWWAWHIEPGWTGVSWFVAVALCLCGAALYARRGPAIA
jgi:uncharacterized membrane protein YoaK (UPF0700 family)